MILCKKSSALNPMKAEDIQQAHSSWSSVPAAWLQSVTEAEFFV